MRLHRFTRQMDSKIKILSLRFIGFHLLGLTRRLHLPALVELTLDIRWPFDLHSNPLADFSSCTSLRHVRLMNCFIERHYYFHAHNPTRLLVKLPLAQLETLWLASDDMSMADALHVLRGCSKLRSASIIPAVDSFYQVSDTVQESRIPAQLFLPHLTKFHGQAWHKLAVFLDAMVVPNLEELALKTPTQAGSEEIEFITLAPFFQAPPISLRFIYLQMSRHEQIDEVVALFHLPHPESLTIRCSHRVLTYSMGIFEHATFVVLKQLPQLRTLTLHYDALPGLSDSDPKNVAAVNWKPPTEMGIRVQWILESILILDTDHSSTLGTTAAAMASEETWQHIPLASVFEEARGRIPTYHDLSLFRTPFTTTVPANSQRLGCVCRFKYSRVSCEAL